jgi:glycosyltransferase involved in cell wall biosynthesis
MPAIPHMDPSIAAATGRIGGMPETVRILHAPSDVGGHAFGLSRAERELGFESDVVVVSRGSFGYGFDLDLDAGLPHPVWRRFGRRGSFLLRALHRYDVVHFNFGQTLLTIRQLGRVFDEVAWLKRRGKIVLVTYQGCDVRPKAACPCRRPHCYADDPYRLPAARRMLRLADRVFYLNPDLRQWLPGAVFTPYASVDAQRIAPAPEPPGDEIVVVHAPTDVDVKGTRFVIAAVDELRAQGMPFRLDLVEGVKREEVLRRVAAGHLLVDQLLLGWYGAVAVEAMALGRPVLCYVREDEAEDNPFGSELPIVRTTPRSLLADLRRVASDPELRRRLGEQGRHFAGRRHDPRGIARTVLEGFAPLPAARR